MHEPKLDGWRFCAEATDGRVRLWSRGGHDWAPKLPELDSLASLGDVVLDGEIIVATPDGRADFELLTTRLNHRPGDPTPGAPVTLYVFDILRHHGHDLRNRTWSERRAILDDLGLAECTGAVARPTVIAPDGTAMHQATAHIGAEGTVSAKPSDPSTEGAGAHAFGSKPNTPEPTPSRWPAGGPPPPPAPAG
jgi:bifunctional non-homologous end joining protein LigD